jgi:hypothetical protein
VVPYLPGVIGLELLSVILYGLFGIVSAVKRRDIQSGFSITDTPGVRFSILMKKQRGRIEKAERQNQDQTFCSRMAVFAEENQGALVALVVLIHNNDGRVKKRGFLWNNSFTYKVCILGSEEVGSNTAEE